MIRKNVPQTVSLEGCIKYSEIIIDSKELRKKSQWDAGLKCSKGNGLRTVRYRKCHVTRNGLMKLRAMFKDLKYVPDRGGQMGAEMKNGPRSKVKNHI